MGCEGHERRDGASTDARDYPTVRSIELFHATQSGDDVWTAVAQSECVERGVLAGGESVV